MHAREVFGPTKSLAEPASHWTTTSRVKRGLCFIELSGNHSAHSLCYLLRDNGRGVFSKIELQASVGGYRVGAVPLPPNAPRREYGCCNRPAGSSPFIHSIGKRFISVVESRLKRVLRDPVFIASLGVVGDGYFVRGKVGVQFTAGTVD